MAGLAPIGRPEHDGDNGACCQAERRSKQSLEHIIKAIEIASSAVSRG
jgi:hypothetical protein